MFSRLRIHKSDNNLKGNNQLTARRNTSKAAALMALSVRTSIYCVMETIQKKGRRVQRLDFLNLPQTGCQIIV